MSGTCNHIIPDPGLGLVATGKRPVRDGMEYDHLFPYQDLKGTDPRIMEGDTFDTLKQMEKVVKRTLDQTKAISERLKGSTPESTARNIWDFVYYHIQYKKDKAGVEQLREPARTWKDRKKGVDCDCYAIFISSILSNLGINHAFRMTRYSGDWQHVYVVVPKQGFRLSNRSGYLVIDPVVDQFNYEVPFTKKHDHKMKMPIQLLNGIDEMDLTTINGGISAELADEVLPSFGSEFDGLDGLGATGASTEEIEEGFSHSMKSHLQNTYKIVKENPSIIADQYNPKDFLWRLEFLLSNFDDPELRQIALDQLERQEESEGLSGLDGFFKKIGRAFKKVGKAIGKGVRAVGRGVKKSTRFVSKKVFKPIGRGISKGARSFGKGVKKIAKKVGKVAKKVGKAIIRYNPVSIAVRNALLLFFKINLFRAAEKLGYGYWSWSTAKRKGMSFRDHRIIIQKLEKVQKIFKKLQGKEENLKNAILKGWKKGTKKHNSLRGLGALPAAVAPAAPTIAIITSLLKGIAVPVATTVSLLRKPKRKPDVVINNPKPKPVVKKTIPPKPKPVPVVKRRVSKSKPKPVIQTMVPTKSKEVLTSSTGNNVVIPGRRSGNKKRLILGATAAAALVAGGAMYYSKQKSA